MECHVNTRGTLRPDPLHDAITALCFVVHSQCGLKRVNDDDECFKVNEMEGEGVILVQVQERMAVSSTVVTVRNEKALFEKFITIVQYWDPDFFVGYEVQQSSFGYLLERAQVLQVICCMTVVHSYHNI